MFKFDKLVFGDTGWGDEFLLATIMTILVSISSMGLGIFIAIFDTPFIYLAKFFLPKDHNE